MLHFQLQVVHSLFVLNKFLFVQIWLTLVTYFLDRKLCIFTPFRFLKWKVDGNL